MMSVLVVVGVILFLCVLVAPFVVGGEACRPENGCWNCAHGAADWFNEPCCRCVDKFPLSPEWEAGEKGEGNGV